MDTLSRVMGGCRENFHHIDQWGDWAPYMFHDVHVWRDARPRQCSVESCPVGRWACLPKHVHKLAVPDSKVRGASIGPIWDRQHPGGSHVGPMNFAIWGGMTHSPIPRLTSSQNTSSPAQIPDSSTLWSRHTHNRPFTWCSINVDASDQCTLLPKRRWCRWCWLALSKHTCNETW